MEQDRRTFLKAAALTAGYVGLSSLTPARSRPSGANDRVRVAVVGFSDRFSGIAAAVVRRSTTRRPNFDIVAVCDLWNRRRDEGKAALEKAMGHPIATYRNTEELYATAKDVDAVIISTADFQHALQAVEAVEGRQGLLHREAAGRDHGRQPRRAQGRAREQADRPDRVAAPQRPRTTSRPRSSSSRATSARSCSSTSSGT